MMNKFKLSMRRKLLQLVQKKQDEERLLDNSRLTTERTILSQEPRAPQINSPRSVNKQKSRKKTSVHDDLESPVLARKKLKKNAFNVDTVKKSSQLAVPQIRELATNVKQEAESTALAVASLVKKSTIQESNNISTPAGGPRSNVKQELQNQLGIYL